MVNFLHILSADIMCFSFLSIKHTSANEHNSSIVSNASLYDSQVNQLFNSLSSGLVIAPNEDYHWYRQNSDGTWSHKPGSNNVIKTDYQGKIIYDPAVADRRYDYSRFHTTNYTQWVGCFAVSEVN